mgnify:CR=1 FL=1
MNHGLNQFKFDAIAKATAAKKAIEESTKFAQPTIGADRYNDLLLESKLENDARFIVGMSTMLEEAQVDAFYKELETLLESTGDLYKEVDMKPRTCSRAVDTQELTESTISEIYSKNFTQSINKDFAQPLMEGTLLADYKDEAALLMESAIAADVTADMDSELYLKYSIFENTLHKNLEKIILPETLLERTENYIEAQDKEYFEVFTKNAGTLLGTIEESISAIVTMIAPKLFEESTGVAGTANFAGISAILRQRDERFAPSVIEESDGMSVEELEAEAEKELDAAADESISNEDVVSGDAEKELAKDEKDESDESDEDEEDEKDEDESDEDEKETSDEDEKDD